MTLPMVFDEAYGFEWPGHVFPTDKYGLLADELVRRGMAPSRDAYLPPDPVGREELMLVHHEDYLDRLDAIATGDAPWDRRMEVPVSRQVVDGFTLASGGTLRATREALEHGAAANLNGGFHHAYPGH
ncbi:MAG: arginase family protein, partial [Planctomycetota bacterium]